MRVKESTIHRLVSGMLPEVLRPGALLVVILLTLLGAPCECGLCDHAGDVLSSQVQMAPIDTTLPPPDVPELCALHCGLLIFPLLVTITPSLAARILLALAVFRLRLTPPPLLPPPQRI